jgi:hypothetical protein
MIPPQAVVTALWAVGLLLGGALRSRGLRRLSLWAAAAQAAYVVAGLWMARVPATVWRALPGAPVLVARRLGQVARIVTRPPQEWERTERPPVA